MKFVVQGYDNKDNRSKSSIIFSLQDNIMK